MRKNWGYYREKGRKRYVLINGIIFDGFFKISIFVCITFIFHDIFIGNTFGFTFKQLVDLISVNSLFLYITFCSIVGYICGYIDWDRNERKYNKS